MYMQHLPCMRISADVWFTCLALEFKLISLSFGCKFIYQVTHEPCTKSRLEQVSSELGSLVDVQCYYTYRACIWLQDMRSRFGFLGGGITDEGWLIPST